MAATIVLVGIVVGSIALMLVKPRGVAEVWWVSGGAALLLALRLIPLRLAVHAVGEGLDVYLFLIGMMLLSALAEREGVFDWLAALAVSGSSDPTTGRVSRVRLFTLMYLAGVAVTVFLSNDATAVVLTPAVLTAVRRARVRRPLPYLYACAMIANAASFTLPISNPANLVVFRGRMPTLAHWMAAFGLPALLAISATYVALRLIFRRDLAPDAAETADAEDADARASLQSAAVQSASWQPALPTPAAYSLVDPAPRLRASGRVVLFGLAAIIAALLVASARGLELGLPTCLLALAVTALVSLTDRRNPLPLLAHISWKTLGLVAALFVLVDAVVSVGALRWAVAALTHAEAMPASVGALAVSFSIGLGNNLVNNLPLGLIAGSAAQAAHLHARMSAAVMLGIDLGSNLSVTGSLATILWLIALRRANIEVSPRQFFHVGKWVMPAGLLAAIAGVLLMRLLGAL